VVILDGDGTEVGYVDEAFEVHLEDVDEDFAGKVERAVRRAETASETVPWDGELPPPEENEYISPPDNSELRPLEERLEVAAEYINEIDRELPVSEWPPYRAELEGAADGTDADGPGSDG